MIFSGENYDYFLLQSKIGHEILDFMTSYTPTQMEEIAADYEKRARDLRSAARHLRNEPKGKESPAPSSPSPAVRAPASQPAEASASPKLPDWQIARDILQKKGSPMLMTELLEIMKSKGANTKTVGHLSSLLSRDKQTFQSIKRGIWALRA